MQAAKNIKMRHLPAVPDLSVVGVRVDLSVMGVRVD